MIAFIGLGGAGGNIADEAAKVGMHAGAINFSQKDLDSLQNVKLKLRLLGSEGVGHNRDEAIRLIQENYEMVISFISDNFSHIDIIFLACSSSGGSGAGSVGILTEILTATFPEKTFSVIAVMPDYSEVPASQANCSATFEELSRLDVSVFAVDNQKAKDVYSVNGKNRIFEITNSSIVSTIYKLWSYTGKNSKNGNFDKRDFITMVGQKGIAVAAEAEIASLNSEISSEGIAKAVQLSWDNSIFAPIEYNYIKKAAIIFDAQETFMEHIDHKVLFNKFKNIPIDLFEGNYHEKNGKVITFLSGLAWCKSRLEKVDSLVEQSKGKIEEIFSESQEFQSKSSDVLSTIRKPVQQDRKSVSDILNKWKRN